MFSVPAYSGDKQKCAKAAGKAYTEWAQDKLYWECRRDKNTLFKTKKHSCAIKAARARTSSAASRLYWACVRG